MRTCHLRFESKIPRSAGAMWDWSASLEGVAGEMSPWVKIDWPQGLEGLPGDPAMLGRELGECRFLLFGALPMDLSRLTFSEVDPGRRFVESSPLRSMRSWRHERRVEAVEGGALIIDELDFAPKFAPKVSAWAVGKLFERRHARLRALFGERRRLARAEGARR